MLTFVLGLFFLFLFRVKHRQLTLPNEQASPFSPLKTLSKKSNRIINSHLQSPFCWSKTICAIHPNHTENRNRKVIYSRSWNLFLPIQWTEGTNPHKAISITRCFWNVTVILERPARPLNGTMIVPIRYTSTWWLITTISTVYKNPLLLLQYWNSDFFELLPETKGYLHDWPLHKKTTNVAYLWDQFLLER